MYAVVNINGKQYQVEEGRYVDVDSLSQQPEEVLEFGNVLAVVDGASSLIGAPFVDGAKVRAKVLSHDRKAKVLVYKMRCKKGYRLKNGHRQGFTRIQVEGIEFPGKKAQPKPAAAAKPEKTAEQPAVEATAAVEAPEKPKAAKKTETAKSEAPKKASPKTGSKKPSSKKKED